MSLTLKGPKKFVKKTGEIRELKHIDIETATFKWKGKKYHLLENDFSLTLSKSKKDVLIYHSYYYIDENGKKDTGRWYRWFNTISIKDNTFTHKIEEYEDEMDNFSVSPATISICFTDKAVDKIHKLFNKVV